MFFNCYKREIPRIKFARVNGISERNNFKFLFWGMSY